MITGSLSLALCTVVFRRFFDSVTGRIPTFPSPSSHNKTALLVGAGALYYLYTQLKKGTLVKIGKGPSTSNSSCSFRAISQRHLKNNKSWFLRSIWGSRKNCTEAICRIAKQSFESVTNLNPCLLLPKKTFRISFPDSKRHSTETIARGKIPRSCDIIYNNDIFQKDSEHEIHQSKKLRKRNESTNVNVQERVNKREKIPIVKRLFKGRKSMMDNSSRQNVNKHNLEKSRRTRSGKVYNHLS